MERASSDAFLFPQKNKDVASRFVDKNAEKQASFGVHFSSQISNVKLYSFGSSSIIKHKIFSYGIQTFGFDFSCPRKR